MLNASPMRLMYLSLCQFVCLALLFSSKTSIRASSVIKANFSNLTSSFSTLSILRRCVVADLWMLAMMMTLFVACYVEFLVLFLLLFCSFFLFNIFVLYVLISFLQFITVCVEHIRGICAPPASPWSGGCDFSQVIEWLRAHALSLQHLGNSSGAAGGARTVANGYLPLKLAYKAMYSHDQRFIEFARVKT